MNEEPVPVTFDQQVYQEAIEVPPEITPESRKKWYAALNRFHIHFYQSATEGYRREFMKIRKAISEILPLLRTDPNEFDMQMFEIMNRWAVQCSMLYGDLGLKFRTEAKKGLRHEEPEPE
ncbi:MAG: hypothetical protein KIS29_09805 [Thermoplasmata archaeon]|nr:hypothetical protein [Candidatus Sysuiplasma jiujiangense]